MTTVTYAPRIVPAYSSIDFSLSGYEVVMVMFRDGIKYSIVEHLPRQNTQDRTVFSSIDEAINHFNHRYRYRYEPGDLFTPYVNRFPPGVIQDYSDDDLKPR